MKRKQEELIKKKGIALMKGTAFPISAELFEIGLSVTSTSRRLAKKKR